ALGELLYDQTQFRLSEEILKQIERYTNSKVYYYGLYKCAWTLYNLKNSDAAFAKLVEVVEKNPPRFEKERAYYLRKEALRDLVIFIGDVLKADEVYGFFKKITTPEELGESMSNLAKLYESYSREKDIHIFMNEFLKKEKDHSYQARAHMILVNANEAIKKRDEVITHLEKASELCDVNSIWKAKLEPTWAETTCSEDYRKTSLEIAKKWWEIWLKNKKHPEFSKLTEKALRLVLKTDNPEKPDYKTRYALAELLFQQNKFDDASLQYEKVGKTSTENQMIHDANYAALFSIQKSLEQKKTPENQKRVKDLSLYYVDKHPKGVHSLPVQLQLAISEYEAGQDKASEEFLKPLIVQNSSNEIKIKAQDLYLDILNFRKDFTQLKVKSELFLKEVGNNKQRKENLTIINQEAHYSEIQRDLDKKPKIETAEQLINFRKSHKDSKLSKEALWQALSLAFAEGYSIRGAELAREFSKSYKDDKRSIEVLRDSVKAYLAAGRSKEALDTFEEILQTNPEDKRKIQEAMIELSLLEGKKVESRKKILELMKSAAASDKKSLQERYLSSFTQEEKTTSAEYKKYENDLINQGVEPFATEYWTKLARSQFENKQMSQAFQSATKAMSRDSEMALRAEARYIQARILEQEFIAQSVKVSSEDRLALVLNIKTEKLDKALTAYNSASKMTKDANLTVKILEGLDRCYNHFVVALKNMPLPSTLAEADQKTLRLEIDKIVAPIESKKEENFQALLVVQSKATSTDQSLVVWSDLAPEATAPIEIKSPKPESLEAWIPSSWDSLSPAKRSSSAKCETLKKSTSLNVDKMSEYLGQCFYLNQFKKIENEALALTETPTNRAWGLFYLSLINYQEKNLAKAHWLAEKTLELDSKNPIFIYQKIRTLSSLEGFDAVSGELILLFNNPDVSFPDVLALKALHLSKQGDWKKTLDILEDLPSSIIDKHHLILLVAEAQTKTGDPESALKTLKKSKMKDSVDASLFAGRIFEVIKPEMTKAKESYKKALSAAQEPLQKKWIEKKLGYLNGLKQ
ncbi:MAG: hypothetical protein ACK5W9_04090, partial [Bdellovibrionales bacterium]